MQQPEPSEPKIILGSSSKYRKQILSSMGYVFTTMNPDIDERAIKHDDPQQLTMKIARAKAAALLEKVHETAILITCDQVIVCNGEIRNKPRTADECRRYLESYRLHPAECVNAVVVTNTKNKTSFEGIDVARQHFQDLDDEFIDSLIKQGDVMHCAGGFAIELMSGHLGTREGEAESVIGLPPTLTHRLIVEAVGSAL